MTQQKDEYNTIRKESSGIYKSKGSKFLSFAYPIENEDQVQEKMDSLKKEFHDARHHCYAYRIGTKEDNFRVNDDGEPSGTAGRPILGQLHSFEVTNMLVVVVRYFGGTLLGTGGLITAYKSAAKDALANAAIVKKTLDDTLEVTFEYEDMNNVMRILNDELATIQHQDFQITCAITFKVRKSRSEGFKERLNLLKTAKCQYKKMNT